MHPKVKDVLHNIYLAETRDSAYLTFDHGIEKYTTKDPKTINCLQKYKDEMLAFYDFPEGY